MPFNTWVGFLCMYMSANYFVSTGLRATGFYFLALFVAFFIAC